MKFKSIYSLIFLSIGFTSGLAGAADTATTRNTIHFTGEIVASTCDLKTDSKTAAVIGLGSWSTSAFANAGDHSLPVPFTVKVSGCKQGNYHLSFSGTTVDNNSSLLKVNKAKGVGIVISKLADKYKKLTFNTINDQIGENGEIVTDADGNGSK